MTELSVTRVKAVWYEVTNNQHVSAEQNVLPCALAMMWSRHCHSCPSHPFQTAHLLLQQENLKNASILTKHGNVACSATDSVNKEMRNFSLSSTGRFKVRI